MRALCWALVHCHDRKTQQATSRKPPPAAPPSPPPPPSTPKFDTLSTTLWIAATFMWEVTLRETIRSTKFGPRTPCQGPSVAVPLLARIGLMAPKSAQNDPSSPRKMPIPGQYGRTTLPMDYIGPRESPSGALCGWCGAAPGPSASPGTCSMGPATKIQPYLAWATESPPKLPLSLAAASHFWSSKCVCQDGWKLGPRAPSPL